MTNQPIRVLIVDDSAVVRGLIARALKTDPDIVVSGTAMHGQTALSWMRKTWSTSSFLTSRCPSWTG